MAEQMGHCFIVTLKGEIDWFSNYQLENKLLWIFAAENIKNFWQNFDREIH